jgi:hypothetical protein
MPIAGVQISAVGGASKGVCTSDSSGLFRLRLRPAVTLGEAITLQFRHPDYWPLDLDVAAGKRIFVIRMAPVRAASDDRSGSPIITVTNARVRYTTKITTTVNVGSIVKSFEVANTGNVPCDGKHPCSPDGNWMATVGGTSLDAGEGNEFRNARISCIAGPCPFTKIEKDNFSQGGRGISVWVRGWSDTTTFLLEAEVFRTMQSDTIRRFYPLVFGQTMNFTLPDDAQGPSIEAELDGADIVFPLGPYLRLSWANCGLKVTPERTKRYFCELKPGYRFR